MPRNSAGRGKMSWRGWGAFAALGIIWGVPYFFIKVSVQELSPVVVAFGRVTLGASILLPIAWRRGALQSLGTYKAAIVAFALVEFAIPFSAISFGERWIDSSVTGILIAMVPLSIALIQRFFGVHERLGWWRILGLGLGLVGVVALLGFGTIVGPLGWAGVACMLIATMGYAVGAGPRIHGDAGRGVHGPGHAAHVLSRGPRRRIARGRDHLHQSRRRGVARRVSAARAVRVGRNSRLRADSAGLVARRPGSRDPARQAR